ncbi:unnamed protein product [Tenebrio molitor]|nr:unnamed protein product [Tenebrio molitor]
MVVYNTFPAVAGVFGVIFFLFIIILILKCCTEDRRPKVTRRRRLRSSYENLPRTFVPTTQHRPAPTSVEDITDIDGIVVVPEPGEASPVVVPPYPVEPRHPTPHGGPPGPGFATNHPPYPTHTPHPMPGAAPTPYPSAAPYPPVGPTGHAPYPPVVGGTAPYPDYSAQPPSYSEAISQPPVQPPLGKEGYSKQAPYNPNY